MQLERFQHQTGCAGIVSIMRQAAIAIDSFIFMTVIPCSDDNTLAFAIVTFECVLAID